MDQFRYGLRNDVKDLLLTFPEEPKLLIEAINRAVRCNNRLFEQCSERQLQMPRTRSEPTYASVVAKLFVRESYSASPSNNPAPMEMDTTRRCGPLSEEEKQRCRTNRLCLYCSGPGHIAVNCPHMPRRQVNQVVVSTKPESISLGMSNNPSSPSLSNKFEILS